MKIFIGPTDVAGIATGLGSGFRAINVKAEVVLSEPHPFSYDTNIQQCWLLRIWMRLGALNSHISRKQLIRKIIVALALRLWSFIVLFWCLQKFDAFIFLFSQTITNTRFELWLMKTMGKHILFLYVGSDARPPYIDGAILRAGHMEDMGKGRDSTARIKQKLQIQEKYGNVCINSPSSAQLQVKPFINWFVLGLPKDVTNYPACAVKRQTKQSIRILHSPSKPLTKGSAIISNAIERLKAKGHPIEFIRIENMPNAKVLEELTQCDFVIDQLYSDTPMAAFATEAAHFGKPAVIGGYFAPVMQNYLKEENIPPSLFVHPDEIEQAIEKLIINVDYRLELGRQARMFVQKNWAAAEVARRFLRLINGDIPDDWWFDPQDIRYVQGGGIPEEHARQVVCSMIEHYGLSSLQVQDKPELEKLFLEFAGLDADTKRC